MYSFKMIQINKNTPSVGTLTHPCNITIWYGRIADITQCVFRHFTYHNQRAVVNELFKKDDFRFSFLTDTELEVLNSFKALKKQTEWVCGRYLTKWMVKSLLRPETDLDKILIQKHEQGAPFILNLPDIPISISHSREYTACALGKGKGQSIGMDIEKIRDRPDHHFLSIAFTQEEIDQMPDDPGEIYKHWTIKEAYLKYIKKGFNEPLHNVEILNNRIRHQGRPVDLDATSWKIRGGYVLSLVCPLNPQS